MNKIINKIMDYIEVLFRKYGEGTLIILVITAILTIFIYSVIPSSKEPTITFSIGDKVYIKNFDIKGIIDWKCVGQVKIKYKDNHGEIHTDYFRYDQIEKQ